MRVILRGDRVNEPGRKFWRLAGLRSRVSQTARSTSHVSDPGFSRPLEVPTVLFGACGIPAGMANDGPKEPLRPQRMRQQFTYGAELD
jgi:hypothetical protein